MDQQSLERPPPSRSTSSTTANPTSPFGIPRHRAASQPAHGPKLSASPSSADYGVIGGFRKNGNGYDYSGNGNGTTTRASSFSGVESRAPKNIPGTRTLSSHAEENPFVPFPSSLGPHRSTSPFPTFSESSSPSNSPLFPNQHLPHVHSPPRAEANVSRSRSQSLATGVRPFGMMPMSGLASLAQADYGRQEYDGSNWQTDTSNLSPFRGLQTLEDDPFGRRNAQTGSYTAKVQQRGFKAADFYGGSGAPWNASGPGSDPLSASVKSALAAGAQQQSFAPPHSSTSPYGPAPIGFDDSNGNGNGGRSGSSSRRHSVSVVGRRGFGGFGEGINPLTGMSLSPETQARAAQVYAGSGRFYGGAGLSDEDLLPERLGNALNLEIDQREREKEARGRLAARAGFAPVAEATSRPIFAPGSGSRYGEGQLGSSLPRSVIGRESDEREPGSLSSSSDRATRDASRSRFGFDNTSSNPSAAVGSPVVGSGRGFPSNGSQERSRDFPLPSSLPRNPFEGLNATQAQQFTPAQQQRGGFRPQGQPFPSGVMGMQLPPPSSGFAPASSFGPAPGSFYAPGQMQPSRGYQGGPGSFLPPPSFQATTHLRGMATQSFGAEPTSPQTSSFSSLSLSDLGKGLPLQQLAPTCPLYIVTFKAGRRDVFYSPDPTLLISNGDRVIVEADRGSDLGTVIHDSLTPMDVRDWQEKQATAALLSGGGSINRHIPGGVGIGPKGLEGEDLGALLAGVGPIGSQVDSGPAAGHLHSPMGIGRPLAKEIMPKRIFAKAGVGPDDQHRLLDKLRDEQQALMLCQEKVLQKGLPMQVVEAEYQWDRRKLTFYFTADKRIDFRDLVRDLFRLHKTRIWLACLTGAFSETGP